MQDLTVHLLELIRLASTDLPPDVEASLKKATQQEEAGSAARGALYTHLPGHRHPHLLYLPPGWLEYPPAA
jgi:tartrate dehydratase alpha subunit/fumarate hydratase class I-like protein